MVSRCVSVGTILLSQVLVVALMAGYCTWFYATRPKYYGLVRPCLSLASHRVCNAFPCRTAPGILHVHPCPVLLPLPPVFGPAAAGSAADPRGGRAALRP